MGNNLPNPLLILQGNRKWHLCDKTTGSGVVVIGYLKYLDPFFDRSLCKYGLWYHLLFRKSHWGGLPIILEKQD
jgi:hypothetical protein